MIEELGQPQQQRSRIDGVIGVAGKTYILSPLTIALGIVSARETTGWMDAY